MRRVIKTVILSPEADESANPDPAEAVEGEDLLTPAGHHHGQQDRSRTRQPPNGAVTSS